ncbi:response regulator [Steroidobacter sp. S1-65]|uniref:histidine kinase n=1 Tax=Steroidobacter gossypii TaxID=2805490 RepID=A0ABS1X589_9GAMM|nr:ATP-binding protein [Steroidobacter gossypii]MBM0108373.1 response regulator [Steroidobacter gossypii]
MAKGGKILVAEDDAEARELLMLSLADGDYDLLQAADGIEALHLLRTEHPDLLITDIVMPRMDGYELVRKLRQDESMSGTPVIFCSASYHEREVREMARSLGVRSTLSKPYDLEIVRETVNAALATKPAGGAPPPPEPVQGPAQERLSALVTFSRRLFGLTDPVAILESTCDAARDILLAQVARLVITTVGGSCESKISSGLSPEELERLLGARMHRDLLQSLETGGSALYPMSPEEAIVDSDAAQRGDFVSMLGVPIASVAKSYGYLCVLNRIGLPGFTEEDLAVARAIATQVAVAYENARQHQALQNEIARRAEMESEIRRLNQDLERRVAERTAELEIANRELEAFSYSVAHDLRAPLRLIHAHVQMLREHKGPPGAREPAIHMEQIQRGARDMSALIDGLLALSRVSHVEMRREPCALSELVKLAIDRVSQEAPGREIEWRVDPLPAVCCDPELMQQVFVNLIGNAVKYSRPRPQPVIEIGTGVVAAEDASATAAPGQRYIFVRDNGVGFDMRYARKLFGVFQRLHRQDEFEGTGIGLATVNRIVERHGGAIWADSQPGRGAEFRFTLRDMT